MTETVNRQEDGSANEEEPSQRDVFTYVHHNKKRGHSHKNRARRGHVLAVSSQSKGDEEKKHGITTRVYLSIEGETKPYMALIDTGSTHSLLNKDIWDAAEIAPFLTHVTDTTLNSITGEEIETTGSVIIPTSIVDPKSLKNQNFLVVPGIEEEAIIGTDILSAEKAIINFQEKTITSGNKKTIFQKSNNREGVSKCWIGLGILAAIAVTALGTVYGLTFMKQDVHEGKEIDGNLTRNFVEVPTTLMIKTGKVLSKWTKHVVVLEFPLPKILYPFLKKTDTRMVLGIIVGSGQRVNATEEFQRLNAKCRLRILH